MENMRMIYARRDNTVVNFRKLPMSYYSEAVSEKKTDLVSYIDGKGGFSKRLKAYPLCYLEEEARSAPDPVLFKVRSVKNTIKKSESPLVEKIAVGEGEIELRIEGGQLYASSRNKSGTTTYEISKKLAQGIAPEEALRNAEKGVLANLEMKRRRDETNRGLARYNQRYLAIEASKRMANDMNLDSKILESAMEKLSEREEKIQQELKASGEFTITAGEINIAMGQLPKKEEPVLAALKLLKKNPDIDRDIQRAYLTQVSGDAA